MPQWVFGAAAETTTVSNHNGLKGGNIMKYVSERVINISELEELIRLSYHAVVAIRNELDKQEPSVSQMAYLSEQAKQTLYEAVHFDFCVERRTTVSDA